MPRIDLPDWTSDPGGVNPLTGADNGPFAERVLGDPAGLTQFGVRMERLPPGSRSSFRHWHETEDEFCLLLAGELVLVEDHETTLRSGDCAAWAAGSAVGHCLENRSNAPAVVLIVGWRAAEGRVHYPDHGLVLHHGPGGRRFTREDGTAVST